MSLFLIMAIAYTRHQIIGRSGKRSAVACAAYRAGEKLEDERQGKPQDYRARSGIIASGILAPDNAPEWMLDREKLWNAVEHREDRSTRPDQAQLAREMVIALPHELDDQHRELLLKTILKETAICKGMVADYALHAPDREGDDRNYHAHVMLTMRRIDHADPNGFGPKVREWNSKQELEAFKIIIEREINRMLERHGIQERITFILEYGREPQHHMGVNATALERRGIATEVGNANRAIAERNRALKEQAAENIRAAWQTSGGNGLDFRLALAEYGLHLAHEGDRFCTVAANGVRYDFGTGIHAEVIQQVLAAMQREHGGLIIPTVEECRRELGTDRFEQRQAVLAAIHEAHQRELSAAAQVQRQGSERAENQVRRSKTPARYQPRTDGRKNRHQKRSPDGRGGGRGGGRSRKRDR